jgi:hypothetical protein
MDETQIELIRKQAWAEARTKMSNILVEHGIADIHNDQVGFWVQVAGYPTWLGLYDLLGEYRA